MLIMPRRKRDFFVEAEPFVRTHEKQTVYMEGVRLELESLWHMQFDNPAVRERLEALLRLCRLIRERQYTVLQEIYTLLRTPHPRLARKEDREYLLARALQLCEITKGDTELEVSHAP